MSAQEDERSRIARELHDDVSQRLAALKINLTVLGRFVEGEGQSLASQAVANVDAIGRDIRDLSHRLHPARLRLMGLAPAIAGLQAELSRPDVNIVFTHEAVPPTLPREATVSLYRVVQEALHNALKYSKARTITIDLKGTEGDLTLTIADDGVGFDAEGCGQHGTGSDQHAGTGGCAGRHNRDPLPTRRRNDVGHPGANPAAILRRGGERRSYLCPRTAAIAAGSSSADGELRDERGRAGVARGLRERGVQRRASARSRRPSGRPARCGGKSRSRSGPAC